MRTVERNGDPSMSGNVHNAAVKQRKSGKRVTGKAKSLKESIADILYYAIRLAVVVNVVLIFLPSCNPANVSGLISKKSKNISMFTCGIAYDTMVANIGREIKRGWISETALKLLSAACLVCLIAVIIQVAGACMSLGNTKCRKFGLIPSVVGGAVEIISMIMISRAYGILTSTGDQAKVEPNFRSGLFTAFLILGIMIIVVSAVIFFLLPKIEAGERFDMEPKYRLFLMMLPFVLLAFVFSYLPLLGWRYAFFDYKSGETLSMDKFVGFKWFTQLFEIPATRRDVVRVLKNTLAMSALGIGTSWVAVVFAIFLSEIKNSAFRRIVQTFTTIPNFISWVLVYAIALAIFSTDGFINTFIKSMGGVATTNYLLAKDHMWLKMLAWGMWKGLGWSAIIYIAAITGIDPQLYEAATVDGAGRFQKMWYITVPELIPTYMVLLLMSIANILSNGMEQYLVFSNSVNKNIIEVLDLYVYNLGIGSGIIPMSTVIGMVKSVVSVILLFSANGISKLVRGESIV